MEITRNEAQIRMFNGNFLELLVNDNEYGMAIDSMEHTVNGGLEFQYFEKSIDERAEELTKMIQRQTKWALKSKIKEILELNQKHETEEA